MSAPWEQDPGLWIGWGEEGSYNGWPQWGSYQAPWQVTNESSTDGDAQYNLYFVHLYFGVDSLRSTAEFAQSQPTYERTFYPVDGSPSESEEVSPEGMDASFLAWSPAGVYKIRGYVNGQASKNQLVIAFSEGIVYKAVAWYSDPGGVVPPGPEPEPAAFWTAFVLTKEQVSHA